MKENWAKGSQWRKWDMHVHTPASFHWSEGKRLREMTLEEREASFQKLFQTIESSDVAVFCFMDYWTFDGYVQFREFLAEKNIECSKTIFPGMELRVEAPVDYRLNIHVILSNELSNQQLLDFKSNLTVASIKRQISDEAIMEFAKSLDASKAKIHGFGNPEYLEDDKLLLLGLSTVEITKESLEQAMKSVPSGKAYIMLPYDTSDGLLKLDWKTQPHADNYFMQSAHIIESRKDETINLFLGIETDANKDFIENFQKTLDHVRKPVICGSDAHRFSDYGNFPSNKATWIKSNPTFEGFKQIIYEPKERVRVQELQPHEKVPYRVIDKVRFVDNSEQKNFSSEWIELNENLNTIIGGKSSGKSLLLYHIAKTIAPDLVKKRKTEVPILDYYFGPAEEFDFEVKWKDNHTEKLSQPDDSNTREIEYIPQLYVNALAEEEGEESLFKLVESILEQNVEYKKFIESVQQKIAELESNIESDVINLLGKRNQVKVFIEERKKIGNEKTIKDEIQRLTLLITRLREDSGFTEEEKKEFDKLTLRQQKERERQRRFEELSNTIKGFTSTLKQIKDYSSQTIAKSTSRIGLDSLSIRILSSTASIATKTIESAISSLIIAQTSLAEKAHKKSIKCQENSRNILIKLQPFSAKVRDQAQLKKLEKDLADQQDVLEKFEEKTRQIDNVTEIGTHTRETLFANYSELLESYKRIIENIKKDKYSKIDDEILLEASIRFDEKRFSASFGDLFNRRATNFNTLSTTSFNEKSEFVFDKDTHVENISGIYKKLAKLSTPGIVLRKGITINDAIEQLFKNYFVIEYNIRYKNDQILDMSPGKRGLVLLQLILHISNATHPILIDQPEDNLDNRTISNELNQFITSKKITRQIIMVTHDANLVVLTDAENIVVSNQNGQQINRENGEYRFEYIAGALENSFRLSEEEATNGILLSCGIREHVCDVLEGGEEAFKKREEKYGFADK